MTIAVTAGRSWIGVEMTDEKKPVHCGCGGEVVVGHIEKTSYLPKDRWYIGCPKCDICTGLYDTEAEAIEAWNTAMGERTAKVVCHGTTMGLSFCCGNCGKPVHSEGKYCHHCGAKLDWSE